MTVRARRAPVDLTPVLNAVTNDWEPGRIIAERAGIDPKTTGPRLARLASEGKVEFTEDADLDVRVYRLARPSQELLPPQPAALAGAVPVDMTLTSWQPQGDMSFEQWEAAGNELQTMGRAWQFWIGDWLLYGEHKFGEKYAQAIDLTGLEYKTLANIVSVAKRVDPSRRRETLSWSHHETVARLEPGEQAEWLERADDEGMTVPRLRSRLQGTPKDAPDPDRQLAPTHMGSLRFKFVAESSEAAQALVKELAALLERKGVSVVHKQAGEL
jgi:hypothetical protein